MKKGEKDIDELIATYLAEGLDVDSLKELKEWMTASPDNEKYFMQQQELWFSATDRKEAHLYDKEKAFELFKAKVDRQREKPQAMQKRFTLPALWRYAAIVTALCALSYFSYWRGGEKVKEHFTDIVVESPLGSRTKLYLPDGTLVWLNAGSRMAYSQGFGVEERQVKLTGEGYFEVKKDEKLPFMVQTKALKVRVLGTKFNFRDYPEDEEVIVSLLEGKVALDNLIRREKALFLIPNERAVLNKKSGKMLLEKALATNASQWKNGYLFFDEELLPDIVKELERSYGVEIRIANDALKHFRFYGNFVKREQSITEVMEALAATGKIHYKVEKGGCIVLY